MIMHNNNIKKTTSIFKCFSYIDMVYLQFKIIAIEYQKCGITYLHYAIIYSLRHLSNLIPIIFDAIQIKSIKSGTI
jgi:hypothetical protein